MPSVFQEARVSRSSCEVAFCRDSGDRTPLVKAVVRGSSVDEAEAFVREAMAMEDENDVAELLRSRLEGRFAAEIDGFAPLAAVS